VDSLSENDKWFVSPSARPCMLKLAQANARKGFHGLFDLMSRHNLDALSKLFVLSYKSERHISIEGALHRDEGHARITKNLCEIA
jgi:hypothetical protein